MDKKKLRDAMKGLTLAGLIAGLGFINSGCQRQATTSCAKGTGESTEEISESVTSCGQGSCAAAEEATEPATSCSKGATETMEMETESTGSCGQGSCGQ